MARSNRVAVFLFAFAALAVVAFASGWAREVGLDFWNIGAAHAQLRAAEKEGVRVEAFRERTARQIEIGDQVTAELIEGQVSLAEAAQTLEVVNRDRPGWQEGLGQLHPEAADMRELTACYALDRVHLALRNTPSRLPEVSARLDAEYRVLTGRPATPAMR